MGDVRFVFFVFEYLENSIRLNLFFSNGVVKLENFFVVRLIWFFLFCWRGCFWEICFGIYRLGGRFRVWGGSLRVSVAEG